MIVRITKVHMGSTVGDSDDIKYLLETRLEPKEGLEHFDMYGIKEVHYVSIYRSESNIPLFNFEGDKQRCLELLDSGVSPEDVEAYLKL